MDNTARTPQTIHMKTSQCPCWWTTQPGHHKQYIWRPHSVPADGQHSQDTTNNKYEDLTVSLLMDNTARTPQTIHMKTSQCPCCWTTQPGHHKQYIWRPHSVLAAGQHSQDTTNNTYEDLTVSLLMDNTARTPQTIHMKTSQCPFWWTTQPGHHKQYIWRPHSVPADGQHSQDTTNNTYEDVTVSLLLDNTARTPQTIHMKTSQCSCWWTTQPGHHKQYIWRRHSVPSAGQHSQDTTNNTYEDLTVSLLLDNTARTPQTIHMKTSQCPFWWTTQPGHHKQYIWRPHSVPSDGQHSQDTTNNTYEDLTVSLLMDNTARTPQTINMKTSQCPFWWTTQPGHHKQYIWRPHSVPSDGQHSQDTTNNTYEDLTVSLLMDNTARTPQTIHMKTSQCPFWWTTQPGHHKQYIWRPHSVPADGQHSQDTTNNTYEDVTVSLLLDNTARTPQTIHMKTSQCPFWWTTQPGHHKQYIWRPHSVPSDGQHSQDTTNNTYEDLTVFLLMDNTARTPQTIHMKTSLCPFWWTTQPGHHKQYIWRPHCVPADGQHTQEMSLLVLVVSSTRYSSINWLVSIL